MSQTAIIIPTLNAGPHLDAMLPALGAALAACGLKPQDVLVIDSASTDDTVARFAQFGAVIHPIDRADFNHGGTRRMAAAMRPDADSVVFMTQDAIPADDQTFVNVLAAFEDPKVGLAYGRQLPRPVAGPIERHARIFNYPAQSEYRVLADAAQYGVKTTFCSDSFAAYRHTALNAVGSFPQDAFFAEDQITSGQMLLAGWAVVYRADAQVVHSHDYSLVEEFRRYFDVGVFHGRNPWLLEKFGKAEGSGMQFIRSETLYLLKHGFWLLPLAALRTVAKYAGYKMGMKEERLSLRWKQRLSMQPFYWKKQQDTPS